MTEINLRIKHFKMTDEQARQKPGWHIANHRNEDGWFQCLEYRDQTGQ